MEAGWTQSLQKLDRFLNSRSGLRGDRRRLLGRQLPEGGEEGISLDD
jgi:hypothetical protein